MALWEETIPLMKVGYHKALVNSAYGESSEGRKVYPSRDMVFNAMRLTPFDKVRVIIIGQDPYINEHGGVPEAHGLCFSVRAGIPVPPSLKNVFQEITNSIYKGEPQEFSPDLSRWAEQGVLLLNASLSVIAGRSNSHAKLGWQKLTDDIITTISAQRQHVVFMLWGAFAQKKAQLIDCREHCILKTTHPSPLSAHRGFLGSGVFVKCNAYLEQHGQPAIIW
ncbi:MAG: uracil-DNA glycosylase [Deltaproteobacteria bacterium]|nr:uracil-DNA glycosylase [Deltaproteobacteria bacterium]